MRVTIDSAIGADTYVLESSSRKLWMALIDLRSRGSWPDE
jgi:hypothetical protein